MLIFTRFIGPETISRLTIIETFWNEVADEIVDEMERTSLARRNLLVLLKFYLMWFPQHRKPIPDVDGDDSRIASNR